MVEPAEASLLSLPEYAGFPSFKQRSDDSAGTSRAVEDVFTWTKSMLLQGELSDAGLVCLVMGDEDAELAEIDSELFDTAVLCQKPVESLLTLWRPSKQGNKDSISHSLAVVVVVVVRCFLSCSVFEGLDMIRFSQSHTNGDLKLQSIARRYRDPKTNPATKPTSFNLHTPSNKRRLSKSL